MQRAYYDAMQHLNAALVNVCADFQGDNYSRVSSIATIRLGHRR